MTKHKVFLGLLVAMLATAMAQAVEPAIDYSFEMKLTYVGVLYQSIDGVNWVKVEGAISPYSVPVEDAKKLFFCAKNESEHPSFEGDDITISLSDTVNLNLAWIKPGTFIMGSQEKELGRRDDETQHEVTLTQGYWMGKYEVTQEQYEAVMRTNPSNFQGADLPVENVSWNDAVEFCAKLTAIEKKAKRLPKGYEYNLPTEAQWEYACRAGTTTALNNEKNLTSVTECHNLDEAGWYRKNSGGITHPVGQKNPNAWGLYDMHGNVHEWCLDWYSSSYPKTSVTDPTGESSGSSRIVRGGHWNSYARSCRSAFRDFDDPNFCYNWRGFRVALVPCKSLTIPLTDDVDMDMVWIEPDIFRMGSPENERGRISKEIQHEVTLTHGYWLGKYEVTQAQYEAVMGINPSAFKGADQPVEWVSWFDATNFCAKLTEIERVAGHLPEGYEFTLPTEAQWEYACRAGTATAFNNGTNIPTVKQEMDEPCSYLDKVGWYDYNSDDTTHPVGQKQPNAWGLYDMHGNVWEWCLDWEGDYPTTAVIDPMGPSKGKYRVIRGGSWRHSAKCCRSAARIVVAQPDSQSNSIGFRVALAPVQ